MCIYILFQILISSVVHFDLIRPYYVYSDIFILLVMAEPEKIKEQYDAMYSTFQAMGLNPKGDTPEDLDK